MRNFVVRTDNERFEGVPWVEPRHGCAWFVLAGGSGKIFSSGGHPRRHLLVPDGEQNLPTVAERRHNGTLQRGHIITFYPKLIDVV
jgi:hypothetical protein